ncbi:MAG: hypothetical protein WBA07_00055 [Rivularia sp. (in: cyanobacteria)]
MFGLSDLKQTKVYQQAFAEGIEEGELRGKLLAILPMLAAGLTAEQVAQALDLTIDEVRKAEQEQTSK